MASCNAKPIPLLTPSPHTILNADSEPQAQLPMSPPLSRTAEGASASDRLSATNRSDAERVSTMRSPSPDDDAPVETSREEWIRNVGRGPRPEERIEVTITLVNGRIASAGTRVSESPNLRRTGDTGRPRRHLKITLHLLDNVVSRAAIIEVLDEVIMD